MHSPVSPISTMFSPMSPTSTMCSHNVSDVYGSSFVLFWLQYAQTKLVSKFDCVYRGVINIIPYLRM